MESAKKTAGTSVDVVVIDDDESIREGCRLALEGQGYRAAVVADGSQGLRLLESARPPVVLLDLRMPGVSGMEVLQRLPAIDPRIVPIVITGYGTAETAVEAMKLGAFDFIGKPFDPDQLVDVVARGMDRWSAFVPPPSLEARETVRPSGPDTAEGDALLKGLEVVEAYCRLGKARTSLEAELDALEAEATYHARRLGKVREREKTLHDLLADLRAVDAIIARHDFKRSALIQILLDVQAEKRWLPRHVLSWISRRLSVPLGRILEIATFYEAFSLEPQGRHLFQVCTGTACHVRRAPALAATVSEVLGLAPGETDPQLRYTLKEVHCLGCCALAPVLKVDDVYYTSPSLKQLKQIVARCDEQSGKGAR